MDQVLTLIGQYAFPIAMCLIMAWYVKYIQDNNRADIQSLSERYEKQLDVMSDTINNNTLALKELTDLLKNNV